MTNLTSLLRLSSLLLVAQWSVPAAAQAGAVANGMREPRITFVDPPTPKAREIIAWAVDRYRDAGLQLPDLKISFPSPCGGKGALYHVGRSAVDFCRINKHRVLHEFAGCLGRHFGGRPRRVPRAAWPDRVVGRYRDAVRASRAPSTSPRSSPGS